MTQDTRTEKGEAVSCYLRTIYLILQAARDPGIICDYTSEESPHRTIWF